MYKFKIMATSMGRKAKILTGDFSLKDVMKLADQEFKNDTFVVIQEFIEDEYKLVNLRYNNKWL